MILNSGDKIQEIIATSETLGIFMFHRGIILPDNNVLHFTERGIVIDDLNTFLAHRHKVSLKEYTISEEMYVDIDEIKKQENRQKGDFRLFTNNCEHFTRWFLNEYTDAKRNSKISPQVCILIGAIATAIIIKSWKK